MNTRYYITTWDTDTQSFTPQKGLKTGPWSQWGLRRAIRRLRAMGYSCDYFSGGKAGSGYGDPSVRIESDAPCIPAQEAPDARP